MNINRNNYENYFLLYVDNELSAGERTAVEEFLQLNPDLQPEFDMFREVVLQPEPDIVFSAKHTLFRSSNPVTSENCEEYFILYCDNELNTEERNHVEEFVAAHPEFQLNFELILSARLTPDTSIVFENKEALYRHEKQPGLVVSFKWFRAVAAAVIIFFAAGLAWISLDKEPATTPMAAHQPTKKQTPKITSPSEQGISNSTIEIDKTSTDVSEPVTQPSNEVAYASNTPTQRAAVKTSKPSVNDAANKVEENSNKNKVSNVPYKVEQQPVAKPEIDEREIAVNERLNEARKPIIDEAISEEQLRNRNRGNDVAMKEIAEPVNENITYVSNTSGNKKNVMRGFFRKASRVFEKTTNIDPSNDDKNINIAGFEIALK